MSFFLYKPYIPPQNLSLQEWFPLKTNPWAFVGITDIRWWKNYSTVQEILQITWAQNFFQAITFTSFWDVLKIRKAKDNES